MCARSRAKAMRRNSTVPSPPSSSSRRGYQLGTSWLAEARRRRRSSSGHTRTRRARRSRCRIAAGSSNRFTSTHNIPLPHVRSLCGLMPRMHLMRCRSRTLGNSPLLIPVPGLLFWTLRACAPAVLLPILLLCVYRATATPTLLAFSTVVPQLSPASTTPDNR